MIKLIGTSHLTPKEEIIRSIESENPDVFGYIGYLQINEFPSWQMWITAIITLSFCGVWYALFDYAKRLE